MTNLERKNRCVDMVFCIDGTGSMGECIEAVKNNAKKFYADFCEELVRLDNDIDALRLKVIVFRDYACDGDMSMQISNFYTLPQDADEYNSFVSSIQATGGGDASENGLEALYYAMKSEFSTANDDRQIIVIFTDADALSLQERADSRNYPTNMVSYEDLKKMWYGAQGGSDTAEFLNQLTKRLVIFAPSGTKYEEICKEWKLSWFQATAMDGGLSDIDFKDIISFIAKSASTRVRA